MERTEWENILIEWVNCLKISDKIEQITDLRNGDFFVSLQKVISRTKSTETSQDTLTFFFKLLDKHYANFSIKNKSSVHLLDLPLTDLKAILSLLLHYTCIYDRRDVLTSPMCHSISQTNQTIVRDFLEQVTSSVTVEDLDKTVGKCIDDNKRNRSKMLLSNSPTVYSSPLTEFLSTPLMKNGRLHEKDKLIAQLRSLIEAERDEKNDLQAELNVQVTKNKKIEKVLELKTSEVLRLKSELLSLENKTPTHHSDSFTEDKRRLRSEIQSLEKYVEQIGNEQEEIRKEKANLIEKVEKLNSECSVWEEKYLCAERSVEALNDLTRDQQNEIRSLKLHCSELSTMLEEMRTRSLNGSLMDDSFQVSRLVDYTPQNLASTVVDVELQEAKKEIEDVSKRLRISDEEIKSLQSDNQNLLTKLNEVKDLLNQTNNELVSCNNVRAEFGLKIISQNQEIETLKMVLEETERNLSDSQRDFQDLNRQFEENITKLHDFKLQNKNLSRRNDSLEECCCQAESFIRSSEDLIKEISDQLKSNQNDVQGIKTGFESWRSVLNKKVAELISKYNNLEERFKSSEKKVVDLESVKMNLEKESEGQRCTYEQNINNLTNINRDLLSKVSENEREIGELRQNLVKSEEEITATLCKLSLSERDKENLGKVLKEAQCTISDLENRIDSLMSDQVNQMNETVKYWKQQVQATETKLWQKQEQLESCNDELAKCQDKLATTQTELSKLQAQFESSQDELAKSEERLHKCQLELKTCRKELDKSRELLKQTQDQFHKYDDELKQCQTLLVNCRNDFKEALTELERTGDEYKNRIMEHELCQNDLENCRKELKNCQGELVNCQEELNKSRELIEQTEDEFNKCQDELKQCQSDLENIQDDFKKTFTELERTRDEYKNRIIEHEMCQNDLENCKVDLKNCQEELMNCQEELDKSREVVEQTHDEFNKCQDELKKCQLELERAHDEYKNRIIEHEMCQNDLENCQKELQNYQRELMNCQQELDKSGELVEQTQDEFNKCQDELKKCQLELERARDEYKNRIIEHEMCQNDLENCQKELENYQRELMNCQQELDKSGELVEQTEDEFNKCQDELKKCQLELERARDEYKNRIIEHEMCQNDLENCQKELQNYQRELMNCQQELDKSGELVEQTQDEFNKCQDELKKCQLELERARDEYKNRIIEHEMCQNDLENCQKELQNYQRELMNCQQELDKSGELVEQTQDEFNKCQDELKKCQLELERARDKYKNRIIEHEMCQNDLENCQKELQNCQRELMNCQQELDKSGELVEQTQDEFNKCQDELKKCQLELERARDEYKNRIIEHEMCQNDLENCQKELQNCQRELMNCQGELDRSRELVALTQTELKHCQVELANSQDKLKTSHMELEKTRVEYKNSLDEHAKCQNKLESCQRELVNCQEELEGSRTLVKLTQDESDKSREELENSQNDFKKMLIELETVREEYRNTITEHTKCQNDFQCCQNELKICQNELESFQKELETNQEELVRSRETVEKTQNDLKKAQKELEICQNYFQECLGKLDKSQSELESCQGELEKCRDELKNSQEELEKSRDDQQKALNEYSLAINNVQRLNSNLLEEKEKASSELSLVGSKNKYLEDTVSQLNDKISSLNSAHDDWIASNDRLVKENENFSLRCQKFEEKCKGLQDIIEVLQGELVVYEKDNSELKQKVDIVENEKCSLKEHYGSIENELVELRIVSKLTIDQLTDAEEKSKKELTELRGVNEKLIDEKKNLENNLRLMEAEKCELKHQIEELEEETKYNKEMLKKTLEISEDEKSKLENELISLRDQNKLLEQSKIDLDIKLEKCDSDFNQLEQKLYEKEEENREIHGKVETLLLVEEQLESMQQKISDYENLNEERAKLGTECDELRNKIIELEKSHKEVTVELNLVITGLETEITRKELEVKALEDSLKELKSNETTMREQSIKLELILNSVKEEHSRELERIQSHYDKLLSEHKSTFANLKLLNEKISAELATSKRENRILQDELASKNDEKLVLEQTVKEVDFKCDKLKNDLAASTREVDDNRTLRSEREQLLVKIEQLTNDLSKSDRTRSEILESQAKIIKETENNILRAHENAVEVKNDLIRQLRAAEEKIENESRNNSEVVVKMDQLQGECEKIRERLELLQNIIRDLFNNNVVGSAGAVTDMLFESDTTLNEALKQYKNSIETMKKHNNQLQSSLNEMHSENQLLIQQKTAETLALESLQTDYDLLVSKYNQIMDSKLSRGNAEDCSVFKTASFTYRDKLERIFAQRNTLDLLLSGMRMTMISVQQNAGQILIPPVTYKQILEKKESLEIIVEDVFKHASRMSKTTNELVFKIIKHYEKYVEGLLRSQCDDNLKFESFEETLMSELMEKITDLNDRTSDAYEQLKNLNKEIENIWLKQAKTNQQSVKPSANVDKFKEEEWKKKNMMLKQKLTLSENAKSNIERKVKQLQEENKKLSKDVTYNGDILYKTLLQEHIQFKEDHERILNDYKERYDRLLAEYESLKLETDLLKRSQADSLIDNTLQESYDKTLASNSKLENEIVALRNIIEQQNARLIERDAQLQMKEAYEKVLEDYNKITTELDTVKYKRLRDREDFQTHLKKVKDEYEKKETRKIQAIRSEYETKLEKMKDKMLKLYKDEISKEMDRVVDSSSSYAKTIENLRSDLFEAEQKLSFLEIERDMLRSQLNKMRTEPTNLALSRESLQSIEFRLPEMTRSVSDRDSIRSLSQLGQRQRESIVQRETSERNSIISKRESVVSDDRRHFTLPKNPEMKILEEITVSRMTSMTGLPNGIGNMPMEEEEEECFNNKYLTDMKEGRCITGSVKDSSRYSELAWRNSLLPPHLKSSYPAETQFVSPARFKDEDIKSGAVELDTSHCKLLPGEKPKKKDFGTTSYKKPGPPTPSKNGGRLSLQGNESYPLREHNNDPKTPKRSTPNRIKALFMGKSTLKENSEGVSSPKRKSGFFRRPR